MPEGDTLYRIAEKLRPALLGAKVVSLELPRSAGFIARVEGSTVDAVEARGKNLLITFSEGSVLHTHLKMTGVWHLYREGDPWKRSRSMASAILRVAPHEDRPGFVAVAFQAPVARVLRPGALAIYREVTALGPDLLAPTFDPSVALARMKAWPARALGEALLDQRVVAGIGNVYKSEICFDRRLDPFAPVSAFSDEELIAALERARVLLKANVPLRLEDGRMRRAPFQRTTRDPTRGGSRLSVYRRSHRPCLDCGTMIRMKRQGLRSTYFCPKCQPTRGVPAASSSTW